MAASVAASVAPVRDTRWLTLEVCREFQRGTCLRADSECKFAHPAQSCQVETGRVIACFDSLKGRCSRENCKYLHPPPHLRSQLEVSGRNNLIQQRNLAVLAHLAGALGPGALGPGALGPGALGLGALGPGALGLGALGLGAPLQPVPMYTLAPGLAPGLGVGVGVAAFSPYLAHADLMSPTPVLLTSPAPPAPPATTAHKLLRTDRLEVCREYQRGNCTRGESDCRFAHPADSTMIDTNDNTVTVCMDYIKGRCSREACKYVHPPAHLQAKIRATQHQVSQAAAAMGLPPVMPPLPKRPMLEKAAGAADMFHTGVFQYQPGLASMAFQQQAFIPSVPMMHGAAASLLAPPSAVSGVPFAASANQIPIISADHLTSHKYVTQM